MPRQTLTSGRPLVVPIRPADLAKLTALARRRDIPRAQLVRELIRDHLDRELTQKTSSAA